MMDFYEWQGINGIISGTPEEMHQVYMREEHVWNAALANQWVNIPDGNPPFRSDIIIKFNDGRIVDYDTASGWINEGYDEDIVAYMPIPPLPGGGE